MLRNIRSTSLLAVLLAFVVGVSTHAGQQQQQQQQGQQQQGQQQGQQQQQPQKPTFVTGINYVRVDAIVTDKQGNPVKDLQPSDFEVFENGKPQKIDSFKLINIGDALNQQLNATTPPAEIRSEVDEQLEASRDDVRVFAVFLDDYHVKRGNSLAMREQLMKFLATQLGPNDLIEVMYPLNSVKELLLTRDHEKVARIVGQFEGRKYDYRPKNEAEEQYQNYPAQTVEMIRNQVSLSALKGLATHLGGLREGRKAIILVSEGYTNILPPQLRDPIASAPGMLNPNRYDPNAGDNPMEQRANWQAGTDMQDDLRAVYEVANHYNTSIYTLDPRGLATSEFDISQPAISQRTDSEILRTTQDTLREIALNTDGRAIVDRNDLTVGLRQVVRDSSAYYLIGYATDQPAADGKFHEIKVRVKRSGTQVRARKGYWAPTAEERNRALEPPKPGTPPAVMKALSTVVDSDRSRLVRTWIGTSPGENGKTRVTFVWEPAPALPGTAASDRAARVNLIAAAPDGQPYVRVAVPDANTVAGLAAQAPATSASTSPAVPAGQAPPAASSAGDKQPFNPYAMAWRAVFDVPPGKLQLKMSIENSKSQVVDSDARELDVPDYTRPQVSLTTPTVMASRTAREFRAIIADPNPMPTADRVFSRTERLVIRFGAYGPGQTAPPVSVRLLNRAGQEITALQAQAAGTKAAEHYIDLPLAGLAAGEYLVEIKAKGESGEATEIVAVRITA